jgi:hypothetical protein
MGLKLSGDYEQLSSTTLVLLILSLSMVFVPPESMRQIQKKFNASIPKVCIPGHSEAGITVIIGFSIVHTPKDEAFSCDMLDRNGDNKIRGHESREEGGV